jgi:hypothetical protein
MALLGNFSLGTVAVLGLTWFALSAVLAVSIGRVIGRTNREAEQAASAASEAQAPLAMVAAGDPSAESVWTAGEMAEAADAEDDYGSRAASGTRFKPVALEEEDAQQRPAMRRVR